MRFFLGDGQVLNAFGDDHELALFQMDVAVSQPNQQSSFHDEEQFIFCLVVVPDKRALERTLVFELGELDVRVVEFAGDPRTPILVEKTELLDNVYFLHDFTLLF